MQAPHARQPGDRVELRQMRIFQTVAEERSFTRAADRLFLTQSAVSTAIQGLERELGVLLIDRTVQPISLTAVGDQFLNRVRETLSAAEAAVQVVREALTGTVTVGFMSVPRSSAPTLPAMIAGFQKDHPRIRVVAHHVDGSLEEAELVRDGQLDLAVLSLGSRPVSGVRTRSLWSEPIAFVCRADHPAAAASSFSAAQLEQFPLVSLPPTWCVSTTLEGWLRKKTAKLRVESVVNDVRALIDFVIDGDAAALMPASFISSSEPLVAVPIDDPPIFTTELATSERRALSPASAAFASWVEQLASTVGPASSHTDPGA